MAGRLLLVCLILAAAALAALAVLRWRGLLLLSHESNPEQWEVFGVDVSSYQGAVDWPVLADQGVDFAFIKATEGSILQEGSLPPTGPGPRRPAYVPAPTTSSATTAPATPRRTTSSPWCR